MRRRTLIFSSLITIAVAFAVFIIVRFIQNGQLSTVDLVSAAVVAVTTGITTFILFRNQ